MELVCGVVNLWSQSVELVCGVSLWSQSVESVCGVSLWS